MTEEISQNIQKQPEFKRHIAYKLRIGDILAGKIILNDERFKYLEFQNKQIIRANIIANIIDKFFQEGEKKYATLTLDDASGQIRVKAFGDDIIKLENFNQGDTIQIIGLLRVWNNEIYILPEIIKNRDPKYLLLRKFEIELDRPKELEKSELTELRDKILKIIKRDDGNGGSDINSMTSELKTTLPTINKEIKKLLEDGLVFEPRPGKIRYLG